MRFTLKYAALFYSTDKEGDGVAMGANPWPSDSICECDSTVTLYLAYISHVVSIYSLYVCVVHISYTKWFN
jgi:hypothetical protein